MIQAGRALRLALAAVVAALVLAPLAATAQNLGRLALLSRLGEPLDAEIEITSVPAEARESLSAQIVPIGVFERFGVTPSPPLDVVRATVERGTDGRPVVRLRSTVPLERPSVNMIVELAWNGGKMVRQYSFNVDPLDRPVAKAEPPPPPQQAAAPPPAPAPMAATPPAPAKPAAPPKEKPATAPKEKPAAAPVEASAAKPTEKPAAKPKEKVAARAERPRAPAGPTERDVAAAEGRVKDLERTMRELQERIDARNREIETLQRQVGGTAK
jgi:pilus assembly protein FimV